MGNFLGVRFKNNIRNNQDNMAMVSYLKKKNMRDIGEVVELIRDYYPTNSSFTYDEF